MAIQDHLHKRACFARWLAGTVGQALRWGLVAFAVMAALRVGWRVGGAGTRPARTLADVSGEARP